MEKLRMKKIFENLNLSIGRRGEHSKSSSQDREKVFFGPKRKVCRKLVFNSPTPSCLSATPDFTTTSTNLEDKCPSFTNEKSFEDSLMNKRAPNAILHAVECEENTLQATSADGLASVEKSKCSQANVLAMPITTRQKLNKDENAHQVIPFKPSPARIEILSDILLPKTNNTSTTAQKSLICKIDLSRLGKNKLSKSLPLNFSGSSINDTDDSPTTSSKSITKTPKKSLRSNSKRYQISPINSNESDPDLSDADPTYFAAMEEDSRRVPSLLSRRNRRLSSSPSSVSSSESSVDSSTSPIRKSRKRKRDPESWRFNTAKRLRNSGQSYVSVTTKKIVDARNVKPPCNEKCRLKCFDKFTELQRITYFDKYWSLKSINVQRAYIKSCMVEIKPKYKYSQTEKPRKSNFAFYLTQSNTKERVCKTFFINTLNITDRMIRTVKEKCDEQNFLSEDKRGKHGHHKKMDSTLASDIKSFIASIPRVESHYTRATSSCEYISPGRTLTEIYNDFAELQQKNGRPTGKFCNFYEIFKDTGIKMHQPKKDLCDLCRDYNLTLNEDLKEEYERHIEEKELSRKEKKEDRYAIKENKIVAVYDLEAILQAPQGKSSSFYYKTKMNCYNFTIAELAKKNPTEEDSNKAYTNVYSYFWDETQGQKGSVEIATCVLNFLQLVNERSTSKSVDVIFYSDNCCGQNKNKYITTLYMYALTQFKNINSICHKYLIKGHTQNENDNAHSLIEKEIQKYLKADTIYTPVQYIPLIKSAKKTGKKFEVQALTFDDFIDIKGLQSQWGFNFTKDTNRTSLTWNDVKILEFRKEEPFKFYFKTSYKDEQYREVDVRMRKTLPVINDIVLGKAYTERFHLNENKKKDLKNLIIKKVIPPYYASYYRDLV